MIETIETIAKVSKNGIKKISKWMVKIPHDIVLTMYDDLEFKALSLPRLAFFLSILAMVVSWIAEQFFGFVFSHFGELVGFVSASGATYVGKKWTERGRSE